MAQNKIEKLLVLGNGYDLQRGVKTSYTDFFNDLNIKLPSGYNKNFTINETQLSHWLSIKDIKTGKNYNFWSLYMTLLKPNNPDWNNIEAIIYDVLTSIPDKLNSILLSGVHSRANFVDLIRELSDENIKIFSSLLYIFFADNDKNDNIYEFLLFELKELENSFKEYLQSLTQNMYQSTLKKSTNLLSKITGSLSLSNISFLNFNYTPLILSEPNDNSKLVRYIHGSIDNNSDIIFGIDSTDISPNENSEIYRFTKTARIMERDIHSKSVNILSKDITNISFIGHSLSKSDYTYFQSIFDYLSIYNSDVQLTFYSTEFHQDHTEMAKYQYAIQLLIEKYGKTLGNEANGKNLLAKLLLENRLHITDIDS